MSNSKKRFKGGYTFRNFKGQPTTALEQCPAPGHVAISLHREGAFAVEPVVKAGQTVKAGEVIGRSDNSGACPVHSSVTGTVTAVRSTPGTEAKGKSVYIDATETNASPLLLSGHSAEWRNLDRDTIEDLLYLSGAANLGSGGVPTRYGTSVIAAGEVEHVLINCVEDDILHVQMGALLQGERLADFVEGCRLLDYLYPESSMHIAINRGEIAATLAEELKQDPVRLQIVSDRYPHSMDEMLLPTLLGREFPRGFSAAHAGVVVLDAQAVLHAYDAVAKGLPVTERTVALGGSRFTRNVHIRVKIGTPIEHLVSAVPLEEGDSRLVWDSVLTGRTASGNDETVNCTTKALYAIPEAESVELLSFARPGLAKDSVSNTFVAKLLPIRKSVDTNIRGERRACISCSFCTDVCPARLLPNLLHQYVERNLVTETLQELGIFRCFDCNLCTYVCPSKIPVAQLILEGKKALRDDGVSDDDYIRSTFDLKGLKA